MAILKSKRFLQEFHYNTKTNEEVSSLYVNQKDKDDVSDEMKQKINYFEKISCYVVWFDETRAKGGMLELLKNFMKEKKLVMANKAQLGLFKPSITKKFLYLLEGISKVGIIPDDITNLQNIPVFKEKNCSVKRIIKSMRGKNTVKKHDAYPFLMNKVAILLVRDETKDHTKKEELVHNIGTKGVKSSHHKKVLKH